MSKVIIAILLIIIIVLAVNLPSVINCELSEDTILLQQAVSEGWTVIIVKDVLATSPNVTMIDN